MEIILRRLEFIIVKRLRFASRSKRSELLKSLTKYGKVSTKYCGQAYLVMKVNNVSRTSILLHDQHNNYRYQQIEIW